MTEKTEIKISKVFLSGKRTEFSERTSDGYVGKLTTQLDEIKKKRDNEIKQSVEIILKKYENEIEEINKKILAKAKLLGN